MNNKKICLLNDSFPPQIDGVANAVVNYADQLQKMGTNSVVVTPANTNADDSVFSFPVLRYPSLNLRNLDGYTAGVPFSPEIALNLSQSNIAVLHSHCPIISTFMARQLRQVVSAPIVLTYHTKYDVDIDTIIKPVFIRNACKKTLVENISACDDIWVVSRGAGENLKSLGYQGEYTVMANGVDMPLGRVPQETIQAVCGGYDLPENVPVYIFVGRMRWYKGIRIILDALAKMNNSAKDFRMVFIGDGTDFQDIQAYAQKVNVFSKCVFTGAIRQREELRAWYCRADLFLFPSTFDTNGLVVREAAACSLPAVMIRGSCAAEDVTDGDNGFLIEEDAESLYQCLLYLYGNKLLLRQVGDSASHGLYISWATAVACAAERYEIVIDRFKSKSQSTAVKPMEGLLRINGDVMEALGKLSAKWANK